VQEAGCRALQSLALDADTRPKIRAEGGIRAVVAAMEEHGGHAGVQEAGCRALKNLASNTALENLASSLHLLASVIACSWRTSPPTSTFWRL